MLKYLKWIILCVIQLNFDPHFLWLLLLLLLLLLSLLGLLVLVSLLVVLLQVQLVLLLILYSLIYGLTYSRLLLSSSLELTRLLLSRHLIKTGSYRRFSKSYLIRYSWSIIDIAIIEALKLIWVKFFAIRFIACKGTFLFILVIVDLTLSM